MSRGPDNIIGETIARLIPEETRGSYVPELILDDLEAEDYRIVHKDQVRTHAEFLRFLRVEK